MKNILKKFTGEMIEPGEKWKRRAAALVMSFSVLLSVYGSLIMPAVSMTADTEDEEPVVVSRTLEDGEEPGAATFSGATATVNSDTRDEATDTVTYNVSFNCNYNVSQTVVNELVNSDGDVVNNKVKFNIIATQFEDFEIERLKMSDQLSGEVISNGSTVGTFTIDTTTGDVVITFYPDFLKKAKEDGSGITGRISFSASVTQNANNDNDFKLKLGNAEVTVPIHAYKQPGDISVDKKYNNDFFLPTVGLDGKPGSSFTINFDSTDGVRSDKIEIVDTISSPYVEFVYTKGQTIKLKRLDNSDPNNIKYVDDDTAVIYITDIEVKDSSQTIKAELRPATEDYNPLASGFHYQWQCPVAVKSNYVTDDGYVVQLDGNGNKTTKGLEIEAPNTITAKASDTVQDTSSDPMKVRTDVDVAKERVGEYDPENGTVTWKILLTKLGGRWNGSSIVVEDYIHIGNDKYYTGIVEDSITLEPPGTNSEGKPKYEKVTVNDISYDKTNHQFVISNPDSDKDGKGDNYIEEIAFTYKTKVQGTTDDGKDYNFAGSTITNFAGLVRPSGGYTATVDDRTAVIPGPTVSKAAEFSIDQNNTNKGKITWTVTINNADKMDLVGMSIEDVLSGENSITDITSNVTSAIKAADGSAVSLTDRKFPNGSKSESYTLTYEQEVDLSKEGETDRGKLFSNNFKLKDGDRVVDEDTAEKRVPYTDFDLDKTYTFDGKEIVYTITVKNPNKEQINVPIVDTIKVDGRDAQEYFEIEVLSGTSEYIETTPTKENKDWDKVKYSFTVKDSYNTLEQASRPEILTIKYKLVPTNGRTIRDYVGKEFDNVAYISDDRDTHEVKFNLPESVKIPKKEGTYNRDTNELTWTFTVENPYGLDLSAYPTADDPYKISDESIKEHVKSLKINGTEVSDEVLNTFKSTGEYTFGSGSTKKAYTFEIVAENTAVTDQNVDNIVDYGGKPTKGTVWVDTRNDLYKGLQRENDISDGKRVLEWKTNISTYEGGFVRYDYTDSMSAVLVRGETESVLDGLTHYMTAAQLNDIALTAKDKNGTVVALTKDTDYEINGTESNGNYTSFKIEFKNTDVVKTVVDIELVYSTTADGYDKIRESSVQDGDLLRFKNEAKFADFTKDAKSDYEKKPSLTKTSLSGKTDFELKELVKIDDSYLLNWKVTANSSNNYPADKAIVLVDNLPDGTSLYTNGDIRVNGGGYVYSEGSSSADGKATYKVNSNGTVTFTIPPEVHKGKEVSLTYGILVPENQFADIKNDITKEVTFENRIRSKDDADYTNSTQTITNRDGVIGKNMVSSDTDKNTVQYVLDINPTAATLTDGNGKALDKLKVEDTINDWFASYNQKVNPYDVILDGSTVKFKEVNNTDNTETELNGGQYVSESLIRDTEYDGVKGTTLKTTFYDLPNSKHIRIYYTYRFILDKTVRAKDDFNPGSLTTKNSAVVSWENRVDEHSEKFNFNKEETASGTADIAPTLFIKKLSQEDNSLYLSGAQFIIGRFDYDKNNWEYIKTTQSGSVTYAGNSVTATYATEWSTDVSDGKTFKTNEWGILTLPTLLEVNEAGTELTLPLSANQQNSKYIYVLKEVKAPSGYYFDPDNNAYYFYEIFKSKGNLPPHKDLYTKSGLAETDVHAVTDAISIENAKKVLDVQKYWQSDSESDRPQEIVVDLYEADSPPSEETVNVTINIRHKNYPAHTKIYHYALNKGAKPSFSIVTDKQQFISFSKDGEYSQTYSGNSSKDYPYVYNEPDGVYDDIVYDLELGNTESDNPYDFVYTGETVSNDFTGSKDNLKDTQILTKDKGWYYSWKDSEVEFKDDKYYYIVEHLPDSATDTDKSKFKNYVVSYVTNGLQTGTFELVNDHQPVTLEVQKTWTNDTETNRPSKIQVDLYESSTVPDGSTTVYDPGTSKPVSTKYLDASNNWHFEWNTFNFDFKDGMYYYIVESLPKDADGTDKAKFKNYSVSYTTNGLHTGLLELTNDFQPVTLEVQKYWQNDNAEDRPSEIIVDLYKSETVPTNENVKVTVNISIDNDMSSLKSYQYLVAKGSLPTFTITTKNSGQNYNIKVGETQVAGTTWVGENNPINYTETTVINSDIVYDVTLSPSDKSNYTFELSYDGTVITDNTYDTSSGTFVESRSLNVSNDWHFEWNTFNFDFEDGMYYYIVERLPDGATNADKAKFEDYDVSYITNGLQTGTFELANTLYVPERGTITINKTWLGEEPDGNKVIDSMSMDLCLMKHRQRSRSRSMILQSEL